MEFMNESAAMETLAFNREEWIHQKQAERDEAFAMIEQMAELVGKDGSRLQDYLDVQSRFGLYSVGNSLLILTQKPEATRLADYDTWKNTGASIKKGEKGIIILEPGKPYTRADGSTATGFNSKRVFDVSQTTSAEQVKAQIKRDVKLLLKALIQYAPCEIRTDDHGKVPEGKAAIYDSADRVVYVQKGRTEDELFREISRELVHAYTGKTDNVFQAQCVSYMLCRKNQVDVSAFSFDQVPEYFTQLDSKGVRAELTEIRNTANQIVLDMNRLFEKQKDMKSRSEAR